MGTSLAARVGVAFGAFYVAIGLLGFTVTGFSGALTGDHGDSLAGIHVNQFHNIAHIGIGAFLVIMSLQKSDPAAEGAVMGVGLFYVVAFVIGVIAPDNLTILGMHGEGDPDNFLHLLSGVGLLATGLISSGVTAGQAKRSGLA
jgi:hypothetical protein